MNWKYVKLILLGLLLVANLLLFRLSYSYYAAHLTGEPTAAVAADLLAARGITVDPKVLTVTDGALSLHTAEYDRETYLAGVSQALLGKVADRFYLLPDGILAECDDGASALLGNDFSVRFAAAGVKEEELRGALTRAKKIDDEARMALETQLGLAKNALKNAVCTTDGSYIFLMTAEAEDGHPLSQMTCLFAFLDGKCVFADGSYCFCTFTNAVDTPILTRYNILLKEASRGVQGTVAEMSPVYALYENAAEGTLLCVPAYRIAYADGSVSTVSALDGTPW